MFQLGFKRSPDASEKLVQTLTVFFCVVADTVLKRIRYFIQVLFVCVDLLSLPLLAGVKA